MMRIKVSAICGMAVLAMSLSGTAFGGPISIDTDLISNLVGGTPMSITPLKVSDISNSVVQSEVYSQVYKAEEGDGPFVYLYQLNNTGLLEEGAHSLERITFAPFRNVFEQVGYLSDLDGTAGFLAGGEVPESTAYITDDTSAPEVSFSYRKWRGYQIDPGEHTVVMYAISEFSPYIGDQLVTIDANVIDGLVANGKVIGPGTTAAWPEPGTFTLLCMAFVFGLAGRFRR